MFGICAWKKKTPFKCSYGFGLNCGLPLKALVKSVFQVSIVAMQRGEQLMPFKTRSGDTLEILYLEELSAEVSVILLHLLDTAVVVCLLCLVNTYSTLGSGG